MAAIKVENPGFCYSNCVKRFIPNEKAKSMYAHWQLD